MPVPCKALAAERGADCRAPEQPPAPPATAPFPSHPHRSRALNTTSHSSIPPHSLLCLIPHHSLAGCLLEADTWTGSPGSEQTEIHLR